MHKRILIVIIAVVLILSIGSAFNRRASTKVTAFRTSIRKVFVNNISRNQKSGFTADDGNKLINLDKPAIIMHRGASAYAPENSIPAITAAGSMGYWGVELDVASSSDGVLYLLHDDTLDRTTNGEGFITTRTSKEIDKLRIDSGSNISSYPDLRIPKLEDALNEISKYNLVPIFDIKRLSKKKRDLNKFIKIINKYKYQDRILVQSFFNSNLKYIRSKNKRIIVMPIVNPLDRKHGYEYTKSFELTALCSNYSNLSREIVAKAHKDGLKVFCWTVNSTWDLRNVLDMGVDFIISDNLHRDSISTPDHILKPLPLKSESL